MSRWVYIATPSGSDLGRTIRLAEGKVFRIGVVRRRVRPDIPHLRDLRPDDTMLLAYDLFHTGLVYPIATFRLAEPRWPHAPHVQPVPGYPAIGQMADPRDRDQLEPDYVADGDVEHVLLGELAPLPPAECLRVYTRANPKDDHALHPAGPPDPLVSIDDEKEQRRHLEQALLPQSEVGRRVISQLQSSDWPFARLDGRAKQLVIESRLAEVALGSAARSYALASLPLCLLAEYELQKVLAQAARLRLRRGQSLALGFEADSPVLSWIPDPTVYESGFGRLIAMLGMLRPGELGPLQRARATLLGLFRDVVRFRNRVAHAYFLEPKHHVDLRRLVREMCETIYGAR